MVTLQRLVWVEHSRFITDFGSSVFNYENQRRSVVLPRIASHRSAGRLLSWDFAVRGWHGARPETGWRCVTRSANDRYGDHRRGDRVCRRR